MATGEQAGEKSKSVNKIHPDLRGGQPPFPHKLDKCRMEALAAICDTFIPSLPDEAMELKLEDQQNFFLKSASDADTPAEVAGLVFKYLDTEVQGVVSLILWLLSTRIGTLLLCWRNAFSSGFPYLHRFADLPEANRERTLRSWATGPATRFQSLFKLFKCFCMFAFFTKVDEAGNDNSTWEAMGYPAPNPGWTGLTEEDELNEDDEKPPELHHVFDMSFGGASSLESFLPSSGFPYESREGDKSSGKQLTIECDVVVVGSGAGGGVCAAVLAQRGHRVIVLEKGKHYPVDQLSLLEGPSLQAMYEGGGLFSTRNGSLNILAGATLGGGTSLNWSASIRTPGDVIEEWSGVHGLELFASEEYASAMNTVCERLGVGVHGDEEESESFQNAVLRKGCKKLGLEVETIPRNCRGKRHSCGFCAYGCKSRQKQSTVETWLRDAVEAGAIILCGCTAEKIVLDRNVGGSKSSIARGILASSRNGESVFIKAKSTVVSCGALQTPILLQKSGLVNPNIGTNLHLHPTVMAWGYFPPREDLPGSSTDGPIMTTISKLPGAVLEVPSLHPAAFGVMSPWESGASFKRRVLKHSRISHVIVIARDESGGSVKVNRSGWDSPVVSYMLGERDEEVMKSGLEKALRVLIAAGAEEVGTQHPDVEKLEVKGGPEDGIEEFVKRAARKRLSCIGMAMASAHQMGSCRMGVNPGVSAVDPRGEAWESSGLFVADASLFPTALGVNPMITVQSLAYYITGSVHSYLLRGSK